MWSSHASATSKMGTKPLPTAIPPSCIRTFISFPVHIKLALDPKDICAKTGKMDLFFHGDRLMESVTCYQSWSFFVPNACLPRAGKFLQRSQRGQADKMRIRCATHAQPCRHVCTCPATQTCVHTHSHANMCAHAQPCRYACSQAWLWPSRPEDYWSSDVH